MPNHYRERWCGAAKRVAVWFICVLAFAAIGRAQTGPDLLLKPFDDKTLVEGNGDVFIYPTDHTSNNGDIRPTIWEASGRARLIPDQEADPRIGFSANYMDLHTNDPNLPHTLVDDSIGIGSGIWKFHDWVAGAIVGVGYAGDSYIPDGRAYYGMADILVGRQLNATDSLGFVLDYDGHRSFMPDVPLPGFAYQRQLDPKLQATIGFPYTGVVWKPYDKLKIDATFVFPDSAKLKVAYSLPLHLGVFGAYDAGIDSYGLDELPSEKRLFFQQQQFQVGLQWTPKPLMRLLVGVGYAFDQRFDTGFDVRRTDIVAKIGDRPFLRFGVELKF